MTFSAAFIPCSVHVVKSALAASYFPFSFSRCEPDRCMRRWPTSPVSFKVWACVEMTHKSLVLFLESAFSSLRSFVFRHVRLLQQTAALLSLTDTKFTIVRTVVWSTSRGNAHFTAQCLSCIGWSPSVQTWRLVHTRGGGLHSSAGQEHFEGLILGNIVTRRLIYICSHMSNTLTLKRLFVGQKLCHSWHYE